MIRPVLEAQQLIYYRSQVRNVKVDQSILDYIAKIVHKTREYYALYLGGSPRASLAMLMGAKAFAVLQGRDFVIPDDVKRVVKPVLRHRVILTPEKELEGATANQVIDELLDEIEVPR